MSRPLPIILGNTAPTVKLRGIIRAINKNNKLLNDQLNHGDRPQRLLANTLRSRLGACVRRIKGNKPFTTSTKEMSLKLVGCSLEDLKDYMEARFLPGMSWANHGEWHIDHIIPCAAFLLSDMEEMKKCFHYTNLQPLWAKDNLYKSDDYDRPAGAPQVPLTGRELDHLLAN